MSSRPSGTPTSSSSPSKSRRTPGAPPDPARLDPARRKILADFLKTIGVRFRSFELLNLSLTHRSVSNESARKENNERLEFLGDAIVGAVAAGLLYRRLEGRPEGDLAKVKAVVVAEDALAGAARELQLDTALALGRGEELSGGRFKKAILADALEALVGALYLDSGYAAAEAFASRFLNGEIDRVLENRFPKDYKTLLQEFCQRRWGSRPVYRLLKRSGPDHSRLYWMEVAAGGGTYGPGAGQNKKQAEREAARMAYEALEGEGEEGGAAERRREEGTG